MKAPGLCAVIRRCAGCGLSWPARDAEAPVLQAGQRWQLQVRLKRPHGWHNPGGFDYQTWLFQQGIHGVGTVNPAGAMRQGDNPLLVDSWRDRLSAYLVRHWSGQLANEGIFRALLLADKRGISPEQWELFRRTGTLHLLVISGLHIGLVAAIGYYLGCLLAGLSGGPIQRIAPPIAFVLAAGYSALAGFSLPTQRALLMTAVLMLALLWRRRLPGRLVLASAVAGCLVLDPLALFNPSFWLSFSAVFALMFSSLGRWPSDRGLWRAQWVACIGLMPVLMASFGEYSLIAPLANIWMVPVFSLIIVPACLCLLLVSLCLPAPALWGWQRLDELLGVVLTPLAAMAGAPALPAPGQLTGWIVVLLSGAVVLLLLPTLLRLRLPALILVLALFMHRPEPPEWRVTVLDVGQGLAIVIQVETRVLVYDLGADFGEGAHLAGQVVLPFLRSQGMAHIDRLILSHADNDHAGAWPSVIDSLPVARVDAGEPVPGLAARDCHREPAWQWQQVQFRYLRVAPGVAEAWSGNNASCVLQVHFPQLTLLISGDIERNREQLLVRHYAGRLAADVLVAPHHGSKTSSSWPLLRRTTPELAIFSAGYRNRFNHPAEDVLDRYRALGSRIMRTSEYGAIHIEPEAKQGWIVKTHRGLNRRYWLTD